VFLFYAYITVRSQTDWLTVGLALTSEVHTPIML